MEIFFKENGINPYKVMGVSKKNINKTILEKNTSRYISDLEYRLCYDYISRVIQESVPVPDPVPDPEPAPGPGNPWPEDIQRRVKEKFTESGGVNALNKNDTRKYLLTENDGLDFENFDNVIKTKTKGPVDYGCVDTKPRKLIDKFNIKEFNKLFESITPEPEHTETSCLETNTSLSPMGVTYCDGIFLQENTTSNQLQDIENQIKSQQDFLNDKKKRQKKKKQHFDKVETLFNKRKAEQVSVNNTKSFIEAQADMYDQKMKSMKEQTNKNKQKIQSHAFFS